MLFRRFSSCRNDLPLRQDSLILLIRQKYFQILYISLTIYTFWSIFPPVKLQPNQLFQLLSDDTRLRCLMLMQQQGELCVCELTHALGIIQPKVSRHLASLRDAGLVSDRRQGQWIYYRIHPELPAWARQVIETTVGEVAGSRPFNDDLAALLAMPNRPGGACCA